MNQYQKIAREIFKMIEASTRCPNCPNQGWYAVQHGEGDIEQVQCEFCYTVPTSLFNVEDKAVALITSEFSHYIKEIDDLGAERDALEALCSRYRLALELVQRGLDSGAIRSKPILELDLEAESAPVRSLAEIISAALADGDKA